MLYGENVCEMKELGPIGGVHRKILYVDSSIGVLHNSNSLIRLFSVISLMV